VLQRGVNYTFVIQGGDDTSSPSTYNPFYISDDINPDKIETYKDYFNGLQLKCGKGPAGMLRWTPDEKTPNTVYYQSYTSYNMGYRITVVDKIETSQVSAEPIPYDYEIWLDNNLSKVPRSYKNTAQQHLPIDIHCVCA